MPLFSFACPLLSTVALFTGPAPLAVVIEPDPSSSGPPLETVLQPPASPAAKDAERAQPSFRRQHGELLAQLRIQSALRSARQFVAGQRYAEAIAQLESVVKQANGSEDVLETLALAYRGQIAQLLKDHRPEEARWLAERLRVLVPGSPAEPQPPPATAQESPLAQATAEAPAADSVPVPVAEEEAPGPAAADSDEPKDQDPGTDGEPALVQAEQLFAEHRFADALAHYERAYASDPVAVQAGRERWGYCLLYVSIQRYNELITNSGVERSLWDELAADVELSRRLAPSLAQHSDQALSAIRARQTPTAAAGPRSRPSGAPNRYVTAPAHAPPARTVPTVPAGTVAGGTVPAGTVAGGTVPAGPVASGSQTWSVLQAPNFVIYHRDAALAAQVAELAEEARRQAHAKWFGAEALEPWEPRCEIHLYPTAHEYSRATDVPPQSPGHTKVMNDRGRILSRKLMLRMDDPHVLHAVLPHEIAHVVFAGRFGAHTLPRWADEGLAVLTEPPVKQEEHLANLVRCHRMGQRFSCAQIMSQADYPPGGHMRDFYAHSVGICRCLLDLGGPDALIRFLRASLATGNYEAGLRQVYGLSSFQALEAHFDRYLASRGNAVPTLATAGP